MLKTIQCVECTTCKAIFKTDSEDFITIYGNIMIGEFGGIVGNNFSPEDPTKLIKTTVFCKACFLDLAKRVLNKEV